MDWSKTHEAMRSGEVIQTYPDDQPYPSALVFGRTTAGRPLHAVCAYDAGADQVVIVTVYQPDPRESDLHHLPWRER